MKNRIAKFKYGKRYYPRYIPDEMDDLEWAEVVEFGDMDDKCGRMRYYLSYEGYWFCTRNDDKLRLLMLNLKKIKSWKNYGNQ